MWFVASPFCARALLVGKARPASMFVSERRISRSCGLAQISKRETLRDVWP